MDLESHQRRRSHFQLWSPHPGFLNTASWEHTPQSANQIQYLILNTVLSSCSSSCGISCVYYIVGLEIDDLKGVLQDCTVQSGMTNLDRKRSGDLASVEHMDAEFGVNAITVGNHCL